MTRLSLRTRLELIEYHAKKGATHLQTAKRFDTSVVTVSKTLKRKSFWLQTYNATKKRSNKRFPFSENAVLQQELAQWYSDQAGTKRFRGVTKQELRKKLTDVSKQLHIDDTVNQKWIKQFVKAHSIVLRKTNANSVNKSRVKCQNVCQGVSNRKPAPSHKKGGRRKISISCEKNQAKQIVTKKEPLPQVRQRKRLLKPLSRKRGRIKNEPPFTTNAPPTAKQDIFDFDIQKEDNLPPITRLKRSELKYQINYVGLPPPKRCRKKKPPPQSCTPKSDFEQNTSLLIDDYKETPKKSKPKFRKRSLRINPAYQSTTDDDDFDKFQFLEASKKRRQWRMHKKAQKHQEKLDKVDVTHTNLNLEDLRVTTRPNEDMDYYEAIENDKVVEIFCKSPVEQPTPRGQKIEILSDIQITSGSRNRKKTFSKEPQASSSHLDNADDVSWNNLFPDLNQTVSADELVERINEIEFQYDPDAFKNLKIEVLSSGHTDEDENDGAEGDDEFEDDDDDVPSSQGQPMPPPNQIPQPPNSMQGGYRPPLPPSGRAPAPRGPQGASPRMQGGPRPPMNNRTPGVRPRAPMLRPRGALGGQPLRGQIRPRMGTPQNGMRQASPIKRGPDNAALQVKRKKVDVLTPSDKDDDDCQVICMQPKNTGLPQIESIQGASESVENSIMKLSDSITLSVRNPPPKPVASPQKSDAKAVANVLASRGITVTASGKAKESPTKPSGVPTALSLNGAVSIVASSKTNASKSDSLPTVDLTDDSPSASGGKNRPGLPYRCDLCPAQYPNAMGLNKHRQTYHKTTSGMCELGVPLINIKQPGILQKLTQLGINNYIPLPSAGSEGTYALPIISTKNPGNVAALGATQMLSLGPVRAIPRPGVNSNVAPGAAKK